MKEKLKKDIKIETIGVPSLSALNKQDFDLVISRLEFEIREFYKNKQDLTKLDNKPP